MASNEMEIKNGKDALDRRERLMAKSGATNLKNYCTKCKQSFKNTHGLAIHNSMKHKHSKKTDPVIQELDQELNRLKNGVDTIHTEKTLHEILDLSDSLDLSKQQIINLIKFKLNSGDTK